MDSRSQSGGLLAAAVSEVSTRYLDVPFGTMVAIATAVVVIVGAVLVWALLPRTLAPFMRRSPASRDPAASTEPPVRLTE